MKNFLKEKQFAMDVLHEMSSEEIKKIQESPEELKSFKNLLQVRCDAYYHSQYQGRLEEFFNKGQEMKKLYVELIELYFKDNTLYKIFLQDAVDNIQEDLKSYHNFSFTETLAKYISYQFIDKKTKEYLIQKYGNDRNDNFRI
jgi:sulfatase maturation enzyme AslB (radical SAM superfamily)